MTFQATKRSIRTSAGLRSISSMFFLIKDWFLDSAEVLLRWLALEVALEIVVWWSARLIAKARAGGARLFGDQSKWVQ